jgi:hypothetical protein
MFLISYNPGKPCPETIPKRGRGREGVLTPSCLRLYELKYIRMGMLSGANATARVCVPIARQAGVMYAPIVTGILDHFYCY